MAKIVTHGTSLNTAQQLQQLRCLLAARGKRLRKSRVQIINGYVHYTGTFVNITIYWLGNVLVARTINAPDKKTIKKSKRFEGSRRSAERFAQGNRLASKLYSAIEKERKVYSLFCFLKKKAILLIKEGNTISQAEKSLMNYLRDFGAIKSKKEKHLKTLQQHNPNKQHATF